jgi:hypothetical protein
LRNDFSGFDKPDNLIFLTDRFSTRWASAEVVAQDFFWVPGALKHQQSAYKFVEKNLFDFFHDDGLTPLLASLKSALLPCWYSSFGEYKNEFCFPRKLQKSDEVGAVIL